MSSAASLSDEGPAADLCANQLANAENIKGRGYSGYAHAEFLCHFTHRRNTLAWAEAAIANRGFNGLG